MGITYNEMEWAIREGVEAAVGSVMSVRRRERIATAVFAALSPANHDRTRTLDEDAAWAVRSADALIAELDKKPEQAPGLVEG